MKGVAYPAINDGDFFIGLIPLPPINEQKRIALKIDHLMAFSDEVQKHIDLIFAKQDDVLSALMGNIV